MSGLYTEADYENSIIELFQNMGYRHVYGPDVERDFYSPLYEEELTAALHRLTDNLYPVHPVCAGARELNRNRSLPPLAIAEIDRIIIPPAVMFLRRAEIF